MAKFLGFKQVLKDEYLYTDPSERINYMWLVREVDESGETKSASVYFGNREYANLGGNSSLTIKQVVDAIDGLVELEDGTFSVDYDKVSEHIDYSKIPGFSAYTDRVDTIYKAVFPEGYEESGETKSIMERLDDLEDKSDYIPLKIETLDTGEL